MPHIAVNNGIRRTMACMGGAIHVIFPAVIGPALTEDRAFKGLERAEGEAFLKDLERGTPSPDGSLGSLSSAGEGSENSI